MLTTAQMLTRISEQQDAIRGRFGVKRLGVFGSRIRGEHSGASDVDVLVEFASPTFRNYMGLKFFLEDLLGTPVDLVSIAALKPRLREHVLSEVEYVA